MAKRSFDQLLASRSDFARAQLELIAELPAFLASMGNSQIRADEPTMSAMAAHYRAQLQADLCVVSDNLGHPLGHAAAGRTDLRWIDPITSGDAAQSPSSIRELGGDLYLVVSVPAVFASEPLGTLTAAYRLNDALARELMMATHTDVSFLVNGRLVASSLGPAARSAMESADGVPAQPPSTQRGAVADIANGRYLLGRFPLWGPRFRAPASSSSWSTGGRPNSSWKRCGHSCSGLPSARLDAQSERWCSSVGAFRRIRGSSRMRS